MPSASFSTHSGGDLGSVVPRLLEGRPDVRSVSLAGSRSRAEPTALSDWDFAVETVDFDRLAGDLPELVRPLEPLAVQWDRLSDHKTFMLIVPGPVKVDLLFDDVPNRLEGPWEASADTLAGIDEHFWDWVLWLGGKALRGKRELVSAELDKMHEHLLAPIGIATAPASIGEAVERYRSSHARLARRLGVETDARLATEVFGALSDHGVI